MAVRGPRHPVGAAAHLGPCPLASCWLTTKSYPVSELSTLGDLFKERVSLTLLKATLMLHLGVLASSVELELYGREPQVTGVHRTCAETQA